VTSMFSLLMEHTGGVATLGRTIYKDR